MVVPELVVETKLNVVTLVHHGRSLYRSRRRYGGGCRRSSA